MLHLHPDLVDLKAATAGITGASAERGAAHLERFIDWIVAALVSFPAATEG